ncbi:hypothetical protein Q7P35_002290 [Cladosporium inversicolor]
MVLDCFQDACHEFGLLWGDSIQFGEGNDRESRKSALRRYAGSTAVATAWPLPRLEDSYSVSDALEEDGMRYFLPEQCGHVPTIESVYSPLEQYIHGWLWEVDMHCLLSERFSTLRYSPTEPLQRLARALQSFMWKKDNCRPPLGKASDLDAGPLGSLRDLIRLGEDSSDRSFDRLAELRAVVSPSPRSLEFLLECEDDILESILQTSILLNRIPLVVFWLIAAFRCGFKKELIAVVSTQLDGVWKTCVDLQIDAATDMYEVDGVYMDKSGHRLEVLWAGVFCGIIEARTSYHKGSSCSLASCFGCGGGQELSLREARTLILSTFLDGHVNTEIANHVKDAALG